MMKKFATLMFFGATALARAAGQLMPGLYQAQIGLGVSNHGSQEHMGEDQLCLRHHHSASCLDTSISILQTGYGFKDRLIRSSKLLEEYLSGMASYSVLSDNFMKASVHVALANIYWQIGTYHKAYEHLEKGKQLHPKAFANEIVGNGYNSHKLISLLEQAKNPHHIQVDDSYSLFDTKTTTFKNNKERNKSAKDKDPIALLKQAVDKISKYGLTRKAEKQLKQATEKDNTLEPIAEKIRNKHLKSATDIDNAIEELRHKNNKRGYSRSR